MALLKIQAYRRTIILCTVLFSFLLTISCSPKRTSLKKAPYCKVKYDAIDLNSKNFKEKTKLEKGQAPILASGKYQYVSSEFFYNDKVKDIRIHFSHKRNNGDSETKSINCIGGKGIQTGMQAVTFEIPFVSSIVANDTGKGMISEGIAILSIIPNQTEPWLKYDIKDKSEDKKEGSLKDLYPNYSQSEQIFASLKDGSTFEYRAHLKDLSENKSDMTLSDKDIRVLVTYKLIKE